MSHIKIVMAFISTWR